MDARYWSGDDNRDALTQHDEPDCEDCGVRPDEACASWCKCLYCLQVRDRAVREPQKDGHGAA